MLKQTLQECYSKDVRFKQSIDKIFKNKCSENNCKLQISLRNYFILNGDAIRECTKEDDIKSVDCILINELSEDKVDILLCELSSGSSGKRFDDVKKKMEGSGDHIFKVLTDNGLKINQIMCLYLGRYKRNHKVKPGFMVVNIDGCSRNDITIMNKNCGFELNDSFFE